MRTKSTILNWILVAALTSSVSTFVACADEEEETPTPTPDATSDADMDGGMDVDPGPDAGPDSGPDAETDTGTDTGPGPDTDAGPEPDTETDTTPELGNIIEVATANGSFTTLLAAVEAAGLTETLASADGTFTVFAPTDDAFAALLAELEVTAEELLANEDLAQILLYHVIIGAEVPSSAVETGAVTTGTDAGLSAWLNAGDDGVFINNAEVIIPDVDASNGVIHVIDEVILPANIVELATYAGQFGTLLTAATQEELVGPLTDDDAPVTVFAPTDEAFAALLTELGATAEQLLAREDLTTILTYHVLSGAVDAETAVSVAPGYVDTLSGFSAAVVPGEEAGTLMVNDANIVLTDLVGTNGIIHVIDSVLLPANIVELAIYNPTFSTLVAAVVEAELVETLSGREFTVFAPTNAAFEALLAELGATAEQLLAREDLGTILTYHALGDEVRAETAVGAAPAFLETVSGLAAVLSPTDDGLAINDANIIVTDVVGTNGVIHAIDAVILPSDIPTLLSFHPDYSSLVAAVGAEGLGEALAGPDLTLFAPNNAAIQALADFLFEGSITALLDFEGLTTVLTYHVLAGRATASDLRNGELTMLSTESATVNVVAVPPTIEGAGITSTNWEATNGFIHTLNAVMVPPSIVATLP